jgi:hypothetical protein
MLTEVVERARNVAEGNTVYLEIVPHNLERALGPRPDGQEEKPPHRPVRAARQGRRTFAEKKEIGVETISGEAHRKSASGCDLPSWALGGSMRINLLAVPIRTWDIRKMGSETVVLEIDMANKYASKTDWT